MFNVRAVTAVYEPEFYDSQESIDFLNSDETCEVY
jgi:hypothetical protein